MINYTIRKTLPKDVDEIVKLCAEHAEYEQAEYSTKDKKQKLTAQLFSDDPRLHCFIVEGGGEIIGYCTYTFDYSTWDADFFAYMDCLYLRPQARNFGIGEEIIKRIAKHAKQVNCKIIQWHTPDFNVSAIKFYHRIGATSKQKTRFYLTHEAINQLAR
jgi:GNAT superfamily N-acetyltransferase